MRHTQSAFLLFLMPIQNQGEKNEVKYLIEIAFYSLWTYYHAYQVNTWRVGLGLGIELIIEGSIGA